MSSATIPISELSRLVETGRQLNLVDVRTPPEFMQIHAKGARSIPLDGMDPATIAASRTDANEPIYVICQSGGRSAKAQQQLIQAGVANVLSVEGGTAAWEQQGLPVERGETKVISLERQVRIAAGALVVLGMVLGWKVHRAFFALPVFVGSGLIFAGITNYCGMGLVLAKMPWNR